MDGVVDVRFAGEMGKLGGLAVSYLEGIKPDTRAGGSAPKGPGC